MSHWDERARTVASPAEVNIGDTYQRELELDFVCQHLQPGMRVLEVGCGNGYNTTRYLNIVSSVQTSTPSMMAFDISPEMISRARHDSPSPNVNYYTASVLEPDAAPRKGFDAVVCIRTLINLASLRDQQIAVRNMLTWVEPGGLLLLVEGFSNGFLALSRLREAVGLPPLEPASINTYGPVADIEQWLTAYGVIEATFHTGAYDLLTRVALPLLTGTSTVGPYHRDLLQMAKAMGDDDNEYLRPYARVRGWAVRRR